MSTQTIRLITNSGIFLISSSIVSVKSSPLEASSITRNKLSAESIGVILPENILLSSTSILVCGVSAIKLDSSSSFQYSLAIISPYFSPSLVNSNVQSSSTFSISVLSKSRLYSISGEDSTTVIDVDTLSSDP